MNSTAHRIRVRWSEADGQGVVHNSNYLMYADVAVAEYLREKGLFVDGIKEFTEIFVVETNVVYHAPARFDDILDLFVTPVDLGRSSFKLEIIIYKGGDRLTTINIAYVRVVEGKAEPLSPRYRQTMAVGS